MFFYGTDFGISLEEVQRLTQEGLIFPTEQAFQALGDAITRKMIYRTYHRCTDSPHNTIQAMQPKAKFIAGKNGHILLYIHFEGGSMTLREGTPTVLQHIANA